MKSILFIVIISIILIFSNINCLFALNEGQIYKNAQKLYDVGAKLMIQDKFTEAKDFFIYCESESMKCKNEELALKANYMIKNCNIMLNLANINEKAPRNELLPVEKLILIQEEKILVNPNPGNIISKEYKPLGYNWAWHIQVSSDEYYNTTQMPRLKTFADVSQFIKNDNFTKTLAKDISDEAERQKLDYIETINFTLACVQSLPYVKDILSTGSGEYYRYPIETIVEQGDCEDTSILAAGILKDMGYDVCLITLPGHMALGVALNNYSGSYYEYNGKRYYFCETTGEGWKLGMIDSKYNNLTPNIFPI